MRQNERLRYMLKAIYISCKKEVISKPEGGFSPGTKSTSTMVWDLSLRIQHKDYLDFLLLFRTIFRLVSKASPFLGIHEVASDFPKSQ